MDERNDSSLVRHPALTHLPRFRFLSDTFTVYADNFLSCVYNPFFVGSILYALATSSIAQKKKQKKSERERGFLPFGNQKC